MKKNLTRVWHAVLSSAAVIAAVAPTLGHAQDRAGRAVTVIVPSASTQGDGSMSAAVATRLVHGPLPMSAATQVEKDAADRAHAEAQRTAAPSLAEPDAARGLPGPMTSVVAGSNFAGLAADTADTSSVPPDNAGAVGTTRFIETINSAVRIFDRVAGNPILATGSLNDLNGFGASNNSFDPQVIWDPTTNRFYYSMDTIVSASQNLLTFGFSKSTSPSNVTTDWCKYAINYGADFPDYPKMGDSRYFIIIGVNVFSPSFIGSDIVAISKPAGTGTIATCPDATTFKVGIDSNLKDSGGSQVFTPVPSNQIDTNSKGYVVASTGGGGTKLWFYTVTKAGTGFPLFGAARGVTVAAYPSPPNATQPPGAGFGQLLDTSDTRNTQAVQAINPDRGTVQSFYTQHTVASGGFSGVRWYEIDPAPAVPVVLRTGTITKANTFLFNGAISPDRKVNGASKAFGDSFVIQYNASSPATAARIEARSSLNGAAVPATGVTVKTGVGPYRAFDCPSAGNVCRWGDYAALTPDPNVPVTDPSGIVFGVNQYSGVVNPPAGNANWRTRIFGLRP